jgi:hypothetical protein
MVITMARKLIQPFAWRDSIAGLGAGLEVNALGFSLRVGVLCPVNYQQVPLSSWKSKSAYGVGRKDLWQMSFDVFALALVRREYL